MILFWAIIVILFEAVGEGLVKRHFKALSDIIFKEWVQLLIAGGLFALWLIYALNFDKYYVPDWKIITGFVFVRFGIFDLTYNLVAGNRWDYYGTHKWYDKVMTNLGGFGWFMKLVLFPIGCIFLGGWN